MKTILAKIFRREKGVVRGRSTAFIVTVAVHVVLLLAAGFFVALSVHQRVEPRFEGKQISRPKMKLKKLQVPVKVKIKQPKFKQPKAAAPKAPSMDFKMPAMGGVKGGMGSLDGGGLGSLGFGMRMNNLFGGDQFLGNELVGTFYDLNQTPDRNPTGMHIMKYDEVIEKFLIRWDESVFEAFYQAPRKKYTTAFAMPTIHSREAPKAFGLEDVIDSGLSAIHYKGYFSVPETGYYRFCGLGNDLLYVRVKGKIRLDGSWWRPSKPKNHIAGKMSGWSNDVENQRKFRLAENAGRMALGDWVRFTKGEKIPIEVLIGERSAAGRFCAVLLIEQKNKTYQTVSTKNGPRPILPLFKTDEISAELGAKMKLSPNEVTLEGPTFGAKE